MNYYFDVLKRYADFDGRARRKEYWMFTLCNYIVSMILGVIGGLVFNFDFLGTIYSLAVLLPTFGVTIRRMHDVGKSGWYCLIPFYNLVLCCTEGDHGPNEYGDDPKNPGNEIDEIGTPQE